MSAQDLEAHLLSARFRLGAVGGRWELVAYEWPHVFVRVVARNGRWFTLRFDCSGYPDAPPTAMPWDMTKAKPLPPEQWPKGGRVSQVFNPSWKGGTALYLPCDRESIAGHPNWVTEYSWLIWKPARGLTQYLEAVHEVLQSNELVAEAA